MGFAGAPVAGQSTWRRPPQHLRKRELERYPIQFLASLRRLGGDWLVNHAIQRRGRRTFDLERWIIRHRSHARRYIGRLAAHVALVRCESPYHTTPTEKLKVL